MVHEGEVDRARSTMERTAAAQDTIFGVEDPEGVYRAIAQFAPWGLHFYEKRGEDLILIGCNPASDRLLGIACAPLLGRRIEEAFPSTDIAQIKAECLRVIETGEVWCKEEMFYQDDRIEGVFELRAFRLTPRSMAASFMDVTEQRRAQQERERRSRQLQQILDSLPVGIGIADAEGRLVQVNRVAKEIWRGELPLVDPTSEHGEYRGFWPSTGKEIRPEEWPLVRALTEKREIANQVLEIQRFDGSRGTILCSCAPILEEDGAVSGGLAGYMDISRQKETEKELSSTKMLLETIIDSVPIGVRIVDADGRMVTMNRPLRRIWHENVPQTEELTHLEDKEAWFADTDIALSASDWPMHDVLKTGMASGPRALDIRRLDGSKGTILHSAAPLFGEGGRVVGGMSFTQDITEIKANERELKRSNVELQHFAYVASHDLQEPLRMVVGFLSLLDKKYGEKLDSLGREYIAYAIEGGERMRALINDLLAYSRIDSRREPFQNVDLNGVAQQTLGLLQVSIRETAAVVAVDQLPTVRVDEAQMQQVLLNLVSNSLKFRGAQAPRIHISAKEAAHEWIISVQDNGIGIDPEYTETIFMMFQRLHDRSEYPGTGVGLAIAKKIVERHGGRIWVSSRPGEGATFYFSLPKVGVR